MWSLKPYKVLINYELYRFSFCFYDVTVGVRRKELMTGPIRWLTYCRKFWQFSLKLKRNSRSSNVFKKVANANLVFRSNELPQSTTPSAFCCLITSIEFRRSSYKIINQRIIWYIIIIAINEEVEHGLTSVRNSFGSFV